MLPANDLPLRFIVLLKTSQADVYKVVVVRWIQPGGAVRAKHFCPNPTQFGGVINKAALVVCCSHSGFYICRWTKSTCFSDEVCVMRLLLLTTDAALLNSTARHKVSTTYYLLRTLPPCGLSVVYHRGVLAPISPSAAEGSCRKSASSAHQEMASSHLLRFSCQISQGMLGLGREWGLHRLQPE